jgi:CheY-like chemotaxis protein
MRALVLLVEDDHDLCECLGEVLAEDGYQVLQAHDGDEALAILRGGSRPAVILLDLGMPRMSGRDFREAQLRSPEWAKIPTVILSGDVVDAQVEELGVAGGLQKPVTLAALLATVHEHA